MTVAALSTGQLTIFIPEAANETRRISPRLTCYPHRLKRSPRLTRYSPAGVCSATIFPYDSWRGIVAYLLPECPKSDKQRR
jgi:hypothetical protein